MERTADDFGEAGQLHTALSSNYFHAAKSMCLYGLLFFAIESFCLYGPVRKWITALLNSNRKLTPKAVQRTIPNFTERIIGGLHLLSQVPIALSVVLDTDLASNSLYGRTWLSQTMCAISAGYFLFDTYVCIARDEGFQYTVHAVICLCAYGYGCLSGLLHYWGACFLLWEISTPFVYIRWVLFKIGRDEGPVYIANGVLMMLSFFLCRNVFGVYTTVKFFQAVREELSHPAPKGAAISAAVLWSYMIANLALNVLNYFWFYKMAAVALHFQKTGKVLDVKQE